MGSSDPFRKEEKQISCIYSRFCWLLWKAFLLQVHWNKLKEHFDSRLCHHLTNAGLLCPVTKEKMDLMSSWIPCFISHIRVSKQCVIDLSDSVKAYVCLALLL